MQTDDAPKFTAILACMGELYDKSVSKTLTSIYWQALQQFELEDVKQAFKAHINNPDCGRFFPKPADIVRFISGTGETRALLAWTKVAKAIANIGSYQSVIFDDPLIHNVLDDMGGWINICSITEDKMPYRANEFQKRYMGYVNKPPCHYSKSLCGISERDNSSAGFLVEPALLLGDPLKSKSVLAEK